MRLLTTLLGLMATLMALPARAQEGLEIIGKPVDGKMGFQPEGTRLARELHNLDHMVLIVITAICILVGVLMLIVLIRFNSRANPTPARFTHNSPLEITWTLAPIAILIFIGSYSLPVLFDEQEIPEADVTIKVTGNQWYWSYDYVDYDFGFDSFLLQKDELAAHGYDKSDWLLATDNAVVVPVGKTIVMQVTGSDVIHSWTIPAFGVKQDAVPGRLAELWFNADREGIYFGQCSELCGKDHAYMPITVKVVSEEAYAAWLESAKAEFADAAPSDEIKVAALN